MSARRRFYEIVSEAVADLVEHGFDNQERIDRWLIQIRRAAQLALVPEAEIDDFLRKSLGRIFLRATATSALRRKHKDVEPFKLEQIKPGLRAELRRRIATSASLIKLNRAASIERTLQRFAGWASSVPIGGSDVTSRKETAANVRRSIAGLPFEERRVVADQGHKLAAAVNDIVGRDGGAIALVWHHVKEHLPEYDARPSHVARDGKVYLLRDSWAVKDGLVKPGSHQYYDEVTAVGEEISCRCFATYIYVLSALPEDMLTEKGKAMLKAAGLDGEAMDPLLPGKAEIGHNIEEMEKAGHPHKQAVAAALHKAYDAKAAGILLHSSKGNALFLKRSDKAIDHPGEWCCPGGSIEGIETPEQAAKRETQEETGYDIGSQLTQIDEGAGFVTFRADSEEFEPRLSDEHTEFRWTPIATPPEPIHPGMAATLQKLAAVTATDAMDRREYDTNGWFEVFDNPLSKVGVYQYSEGSVIKGGDPKKMVGVYRPAEELGSEECVNSFRLMPWTDDHPSTLLGDESKGFVPAEKKGVHGVIGEQVYFKDDTLYANLKVFSESLAKKIAAGKRELSCGYHCDFIPQEGVYEGTPYQYVQRGMRGNHFSSVPKGRMGSEVRVLDAADAFDSELAATTRFTFSLDMREPEMPEMRKDEKDCSLDADTTKFIEDSFNSLVGELEKKGYSKEYATKVAGKVAAEKGMTGHHSTDSKVNTMPAIAVDTKTEEELRAAADAHARDEESDEEEADEKEAAKDAAEEKDDEKKDDKEAKDRGRARDRRAGARDARKSARDSRRAARDKAAKDAEKEEKKEAAKDNGMDAAAVAALVKKEVAATAMDATQVAALIRKDETAKHKLYQRLSPIVGAFDHDEMSHADMAVYGLKKLGAPESKDPVTALDYYLAGRGQAAQPHVNARDSAAGGTSLVDSYLQ